MATIYLAGPIDECTTGECHEWREKIKAKFPENTYLDPMVRFGGSDTSIVEGDKADIRKSDLVLAYCWKKSFGTPMEIIYAHMIGIPVFAVVPKGVPVSPWIRYHVALVLDNIDEVTLLYEN
jgi:nucleoside 2-deoxyribosyltransferase